jgi:predicted nucleic acid-binding protein
MLVDTSIWINHFRRRDPRLVGLLEDSRVTTHDFVMGELACGALKHRSVVLNLLAALPKVGLTTHDEVLEFVSRHALAGTGIGWVDAHLLASALVAGESLWTADRALATAARRVGVASEIQDLDSVVLNRAPARRQN